MTPKEAIAQFMRGEYQQGGIAKTFGWYAVEWREGVFEIHWRATEAFTTGQMSVIHGGAITTLLDTAMGWAAYTMLQDDENFATADLQVQFVDRGARPLDLTVVELLQSRPLEEREPPLGRDGSVQDW